MKRGLLLLIALLMLTGCGAEDMLDMLGYNLDGPPRIYDLEYAPNEVPHGYGDAMLTGAYVFADAGHDVIAEEVCALTDCGEGEEVCETRMLPVYGEFSDRIGFHGDIDTNCPLGIYGIDIRVIDGDELKSNTLTASYLIYEKQWE